LVGAADGSLVAGTKPGWYLSLNRPPGTLQISTYTPIWAALYAMVGVSGWLAWRRSFASRPLRLWGWQLATNAFWVPAFFALRSPPLALALAIVLVALIVLTMRAFAALRPIAAWLLAPYLAWACYATYLTAGFWWLNPT